MIFITLLYLKINIYMSDFYIIFILLTTKLKIITSVTGQIASMRKNTRVGLYS